MLTKLEKDILNQWRETCKESERISSAMLNTKWYQVRKDNQLLKQMKENHNKWTILFNLLSRHKVFEKNIAN